MLYFGALSAIHAQVSTSRLTGTVEDYTSAAVAGASVTIRNEDTGATLSSVTTESGVYTFDALPTGRYTVLVEAKGFKKASLSSNEVRIGQPTTVNVTLGVGQLTETVEVVGAAEAVQTSTSGNYGNVFTEQVITDVPIVVRADVILRNWCCSPSRRMARTPAAGITYTARAIGRGTSL